MTPAYDLHLMLQQDPSISPSEVDAWVQRWYVLSMLTERYSDSDSLSMEADVHTIEQDGFKAFYEGVSSKELSENFWEMELPRQLMAADRNSPAFLVYLTAQVKAADNTLFTCDVKVSDALGTTGNIHHIFPVSYLKNCLGATPDLYDQVANYVLVEREINTTIGNSAPKEYFRREFKAVCMGRSHYGDIKGDEEFWTNLAANCIPGDIFNMDADDYEYFLSLRRHLMAEKIRKYFLSL